MLALVGADVASYRAEDKQHLLGSGIASKRAMLDAAPRAQERACPAHIAQLGLLSLRSAACEPELWSAHGESHEEPPGSHQEPHGGRSTATGKLALSVPGMCEATTLLGPMRYPFVFLDAQRRGRSVAGDCLTCGRRPGT